MNSTAESKAPLLENASSTTAVSTVASTSTSIIGNKTQLSAFEAGAIVIPSASSLDAKEERVGSEASPEEIENEEKEITFQTHFDALLRFCAEILKYKMNADLQLESVTNSNIIKTFLNNYHHIYKQTREKPSHVFAVQEVWALCQKHLKRDRKDQTVDLISFAHWLPNSSLSIRPPIENTRAKIMITSIYINADRISNTINAKAEFAQKTGDQKAADELYANPAFNYSNKFILLLLRLFQYSVSKDNKIVFTPIEIVSEAILKLEQELGMRPDEEPEYGSGLGDILSIINDLTNTVGIKLPNLPPGGLSKKNLNRAMGEMRSKPDLKSKFQNMFDGLNINVNDPSSLPQAFSKLMSTMQETAKQEPEFIQRSRNATVENPTGATSSSSSSSSTSTDLVVAQKKN
ncbi:MAG: hypothetical protein Solivirus6_9 [Solivirus sp.]|uniref:Uncharacterized protein n=1 Tax=Solivirus sp. TaxID=2487772 RepID=A0A3G5AFY9_9VIRU|nr:MAG: hypothetical protein Solivirus6_9 [Solivirus sp.]